MTKLVLVILLQILSARSSAEKTSFTFDDIFDPQSKPKSFEPHWLKNEDEFIYISPAKDIMKCFTKKDKNCKTLVPAKITEEAVHRFLSPDETLVLLSYNPKKLWRHSFSADYKILDINQTKPVPFEKDLQYANWGNIEQKISYVKGNNLRVYDVQSKVTINITTDGDQNTLNGVPDWLYEEDVLSSRVAHYWSPNDKHLCFAKFKQNGVKKQHWLKYENINDTYDTLVSVHYPKAGLVNGKNPSVSLHVRKIGNDEVVELESPKDVGDEKYFLQVTWKDNDNLFVTWVNRNQSKAFNVIYDVSKMAPPEPLKPSPLWTYEQTNGWIANKPQAPIFAKDGILTLEPHVLKLDNKSHSWRHPVKIADKAKGNQERTFLLNTAEEVSELLSYDEKEDTLYYITTNGKPGERHVSKIVAGKNSSCLTCELPNCKYSSASFNSKSKYYFHNCYGPEYPSYTLKAVEKNEMIKVYEDNKVLKDKMASKLTPVKNYFHVDEKDYKINIELYTPADKKKGEKFPLMIHTYAGPGTQEVSEKYDIGTSTKNWLIHLTSTYRIAVASIDGRGSIGSGEDFKFKIYKKLGVVEVEDQIKGTKYLKENVEWIDSKKPVAIFGWSYGGQTALQALASENSTFQCGLAVAAVASQALYDTAYAERYLGLANDNKDVYEKTDVTRKAKSFKGKKLLLAHGTADDNVHYSHFAHLVKELEANEVKFTQLTYPDEDHSISTRGASRHLFSSMTDFVIGCYGSQTSSASNAVSTKALGLIAIASIFSVLL